MLDVLHRAKGILPLLLKKPLSSWNSLDIDYEPPRVERLWMPFEDDYRLMLHRIHPCEKALLHPHPWPSAVKIVCGEYEMEVSTQLPLDTDKPTTLAKFVLCDGSAYEMTNIYSWHSVRPLTSPSLSIMVIGAPYIAQVYSHDKFGKKADLKPLSDAAKKNLWREFRDIYL